MAVQRPRTTRGTTRLSRASDALLWHHELGASGWQLTMTRFVGSLLLGFAQQVLVAASARPTKRS
eukprot:1781147-Prorocentrum_lima.AAC.1